MAKLLTPDSASFDWNAKARLYDVSGTAMLHIIDGPIKTCLMVPKGDPSERFVYLLIMEGGAQIWHDEVIRLAHLLP